MNRNAIKDYLMPVAWMHFCIGRLQDESKSWYECRSDWDCRRVPSVIPAVGCYVTDIHKQHFANVSYCFLTSGKRYKTLLLIQLKKCNVILLVRSLTNIFLVCCHYFIYNPRKICKSLLSICIPVINFSIRTHINRQHRKALFKKCIFFSNVHFHQNIWVEFFRRLQYLLCIYFVY
jgi:hypothetical protein